MKRIGIAAPSGRLAPQEADAVAALAQRLYPTQCALTFHPQCFLEAGHFAGDDAARAAAFIELANDPGYDAVWFARGGYGSCRMAEAVLAGLKAPAREKTYLGYSDAGSLLAGLYKHGYGRVAHGPMPADIKRENGAEAVARGLRYLVEGAPDAIEPGLQPGARHAAFNITILSLMLATPLEPDLAGHVLLLEETGEYMYRIDRSLFHITSNPNIRKVAGIKLGRCDAIPRNDPEFGLTDEEVMRFWCARAGIPYLGRADIGHDIANKVVPFG